MKQLDYTQTANRVLEAFSQGGAFLTAGKMGDANPCLLYTSPPPSCQPLFYQFFQLF